MGPASLPTLDFDEFHDRDLPARIASGNGALAAADLQGVAPLSIELTDGRAVTYVHAGDTVRIERGVTDDTGAVVVLDPEVWSDFANELRTSFGLLYAGLVEARRGSLEHLIRWEPALRAMFVGRPVYDPAQVELRDRGGAPLDLTRSFSATDDPADLRHFFLQTGFAHVQAVVDLPTVAALAAEVERLEAQARPGDDRSWWAIARDGSDVLCRLTYVNERSDLLARAHEMPAVRQLVDAVAPEGPRLAVFADRSDGHSVVIKNPDVAEGLSDLPWHNDCGLGGHPVLCPTVLVGIQLDAASPGAGQLRFLAGSWRTSCHPLTDDQLSSGDHPVVAVETQPGDVTIHLGHGMHCAPPPTGAATYRRTLYLAWNNPEVTSVVPPGSGYNDVVLRSGEGNRVRSVPEQLAPT